MPNLTDIERIIDSAMKNRASNGISAADLATLLGNKLRELQKTPDKFDATVKSLMESVGRLPKTLFDAFPYRTSTVAKNGDFIRLPFHARKFRLVYVEGLVDASKTHLLTKILRDHKISAYEPWIPDDEPDAKQRPTLGNIAFYGLDFQDGDLGQYKEFFLLIKLNSRTSPTDKKPNDMFVWRLAVNSDKAAAWGSPWFYPKKYYPDGIELEFNDDPDAADTDVARTLIINPGEVEDRDRRITRFPRLEFRRLVDHNKIFSNPPLRWSHEGMGGGFNFVNPGTVRHPLGYLAPIENQGEFFYDPYDHSKQRHVLSWEDSGEFEVLEDIEWKYVFYGRNFQGVALEGAPIQGSLRPPQPVRLASQPPPP